MNAIAGIRLLPGSRELRPRDPLRVPLLLGLRLPRRHHPRRRLQDRERRELQ